MGWSGVTERYDDVLEVGTGGVSGTTQQGGADAATTGADVTVDATREGGGTGNGNCPWVGASF
jgi:hypothetical protein